MGWKKTTNNNGGSTDLQKQERERERREAEGRIILQSTEKLRREMNLRLLTEQEIDRNDPRLKYMPPERVLYVESITVTDIRYPKSRNRKETGKRVKRRT